MFTGPCVADGAGALRDLALALASSCQIARVMPYPVSMRLLQGCHLAAKAVLMRWQPLHRQLKHVNRERQNELRSATPRDAA